MQYPEAYQAKLESIAASANWFVTTLPQTMVSAFQNQLLQDVSIHKTALESMESSVATLLL